MIPQNRSDLVTYCLRKLGFPVIEINLDRDQIEDRVDEAISLWSQFHFDAVRKFYMSYQLKQADINNKWIPVEPLVIGVNRIFTLSTDQVNSGSTNNFNMFDINYQIRLNELYDFTSADYVYFELANQHIRTLEMLFIGETPIRYNQYENKLWLDLDWQGTVSVGSYIIAEVWGTLDLTTVSTNSFWNDNWLKRYTTALLKRQWGENLKKFQGVQLPGGISLNGQQIWNEADTQCTALEQELRDIYEMPPQFEVG
jgi:hypothetical protein